MRPQVYLFCPLQEGALSCLPLLCDLDGMTPTQRTKISKGKCVTLLQQTAASAFLEWSRLTSPVTRHLAILSPDMMCWEGHFPLWWFFQKPQTPLQSWENIRQTQIKGHSTKYLVRTFQECQGHERWGKVLRDWPDWRRLRSENACHAGS